MNHSKNTKFILDDQNTCMLIQYSNAQKKENSKACTVGEYEFPSKEIGLAIVHIQGRFPETGKAVNHLCDEIYYVISGTGIIHQEAGNYTIKTGDAFFFEKGKRYRVEGENLQLTITNHPTWFLQQYENI